MANQSKRVWTFLVYPESVKESWKSDLDEKFIPFVCSPLHSSDLNEDGSTKKPHYHVILIFEGKKTYQSIREITDSINATIPFPVMDTRKMIRYLIHIDNPEKAQYEIRDIENHAGLDISKYFLPTSEESLHILADIMKFIEDNSITEFCSFESYCRECRFDDWYYTFKCEKHFIDMKIRSLRNALKNITGVSQ